MIEMQIIYSNNQITEKLNSLRNYCIIVADPPWSSISQKLQNKPAQVILPQSVDLNYLEKLSKLNIQADILVGLGGGLAIDVAKFISWKKNMPLIRIPSVLSVDAFLTKEIGARIKNKVIYIGKSEPNEIIIDFSLIKSAPTYLNYAGTCDVLSICTALGDWIISNEYFRVPIDQEIFNKAKSLAKKMINNPQPVKELSEEGIKFLVECLKDEYLICNEYGSARLEEGGEHHLAYCIEKISSKRYIHGCLVGLNILVILKIQESYAVFEVDELKSYFDEIGNVCQMNKIGITPAIYKKALKNIHKYVIKENLDKGIFWLKNYLTSAKIDEISWSERFRRF